MTLANRTTATRWERTTNLQCVRDTRYVHPSRLVGIWLRDTEGVNSTKLAFTKIPNLSTRFYSQNKIKYTKLELPCILIFSLKNVIRHENEVEHNDAFMIKSFLIIPYTEEMFIVKREKKNRELLRYANAPAISHENY